MKIKDNLSIKFENNHYISYLLGILKCNSNPDEEF